MSRSNSRRRSGRTPISGFAAELGAEADTSGLTELEPGLDTSAGERLGAFYAALLGGEVGPGGLALADILAADGAALLRTVTPAPGEVRTATFDLDLKKRGGEALPVRLLHKVAFAGDGTPGSSRTLVIHRGRGSDTGDSLRAAEVRFARFFNN